MHTQSNRSSVYSTNMTNNHHKALLLKSEQSPKRKTSHSPDIITQKKPKAELPQTAKSMHLNVTAKDESQPKFLNKLYNFNEIKRLLKSDLQFTTQGSQMEHYRPIIDTKRSGEQNTARARSLSKERPNLISSRNNELISKLQGSKTTKNKSAFISKTVKDDKEKDKKLDRAYRTQYRNKIPSQI